MKPAWHKFINDWANEIVCEASEDQRRSMAAGSWADLSLLDGWEEIPEDCRVEAHEGLVATVREIAGHDVTWRPTHRITWIPHPGEPEEWEVMLCEGSAYTYAEWANCDGADWTVDDDGYWLFQGQAAPYGGGTVEVERL